MKKGDTVIVSYDGQEIEAVVTQVHSDQVVDVSITKKDGSTFLRSKLALQNEATQLHEGQWKAKS